MLGRPHQKVSCEPFAEGLEEAIHGPDAYTLRRPVLRTVTLRSSRDSLVDTWRMGIPGRGNSRAKALRKELAFVAKIKVGQHRGVDAPRAVGVPGGGPGRQGGGRGPRCREKGSHQSASGFTIIVTASLASCPSLGERVALSLLSFRGCSPACAPPPRHVPPPPHLVIFLKEHLIRYFNISHGIYRK